MLAAQADGTTVVTVEGLDKGNPDLAQTIREAFQTNHGLQCGFCTPGMLITTLDLIKRKGGPELDEQTVRNELSGNICRCTGYVNIVAAVLDANRKHERSRPATALGRRAERRRSLGTDPRLRGLVLVGLDETVPLGLVLAPTLLGPRALPVSRDRERVARYTALHDEMAA